MKHSNKETKMQRHTSKKYKDIVIRICLHSSRRDDDGGITKVFEMALLRTSFVEPKYYKRKQLYHSLLVTHSPIIAPRKVMGVYPATRWMQDVIGRTSLGRFNRLLPKIYQTFTKDLPTRMKQQIRMKDD